MCECCSYEKNYSLSKKYGLWNYDYLDSYYHKIYALFLNEFTDDFTLHIQTLLRMINEFIQYKKKKIIVGYVFHTYFIPYYEQFYECFNCNGNVNQIFFIYDKKREYALFYCFDCLRVKVMEKLFLEKT